MNIVRLFAILYCGSLSVIVIWRHRQQSRYARLLGPFETPEKVLGRWRIPRLNNRQFHLVGFCFVGCLVLGMLQPTARIALATAIPLYFVYFGQFLGISYVVRKSNLIPQILLILVLSPSIDKALPVASSRWVLLTIQALLVQVYLSSAYSKLRNTGFAWVSAREQQGILLFHDLCYDLPFSRRLANIDRLCWLMGISAFVFEASFWIILVISKLSWIYAIVGILFHVTTWFLMKIDYMTYQGPAYWVLVVTPLAHRLLGLVNQ